MEESSSGGAVGGLVLIIQLAILIFMIVTIWKIFTKADQPGWAALIPIYNMYVMLKIVGKPWWWLLLMFIPVVGIVVGIIVTLALATNFSKGVGFVVGLILLPFIFYPILAFGSAEYQSTPAET